MDGDMKGDWDMNENEDGDVRGDGDKDGLRAGDGDKATRTGSVRAAGQSARS